MEMRFVFLTVLIASILVACSPLLVDSSPPSPTISSSSSSPLEAARSGPNSETNGGYSFSSPPPRRGTNRSSRHHVARSDRDRRNRGAALGGINLGKKIGLLFVGMAVVLQIAVVGFLGLKRWQISNVKEEGASDSPA